MINYTVDNLEVLVEQLRKEGVMILNEIKTYNLGKFIQILYIEENK